jgi:exodeoxyribonuclease-3
VRIATWNVNSVVARLPRLLDWLGTADPDVVCLQEVKCAQDAFPYDEVGELGYEAAVHGAGRWNGVAIVSRVGIDDVRFGLADEPGYLADNALLPAPEQRAMAATCGGLRLWSVYVPNGREVGHAHYAYKLEWLAALRVTVNQEMAGALTGEMPKETAGDTAGAPATAGPLRAFAVLGDFNIAPTDADVWDPGVFGGSTHVTPPERDALAELGSAGLAEVMPRALKHDVPFTYWDYRQLAFPHNHGMRIDLVWGDDRFRGAVTDAYVDRDARKGKGTSDHAPVVVDLDLPEAAG